MQQECIMRGGFSNYVTTTIQQAIAAAMPKPRGGVEKPQKEIAYCNTYSQADL